VTLGAFLIKFFVRISVQKNRLYAIPWLLWETASLLMQILGFMYYAKHKKNELDRWFTSAAILNIGNIKL
jgi:hypothetical protein